ncbi:nicotinate phosphoribosyltransferase [Microthyrium microscopicum]|uniref:Nicotinate phosphoribosyltransferase n=1 Tax=Microthyrium microscopicum TaxID=703497 RepID=A0A6A6U6C4_9PEZI|nr:nicotinate phosphoribosyltransferase [Microthyrium microscopicum]
MASPPPEETPEGVYSILDTDLYKLTMQCCILKYYPTIDVTYNFTNRTPHKKFNRKAVDWLQAQIDKLANLFVTKEELDWLHKTCPYLPEAYIAYLGKLRLQPDSQVELTFHQDPEADRDVGAIHIKVRGKWIETILYEIPLLALISEAYFKFVDKDWNYDNQVENACEKGRQLIQAGCVFSEFGSRRRRSYKAQELVIHGLLDAAKEGKEKGWKGKLSGTSNVHFAMRFGLLPIGTVAHEWFMGVAAITDDYENANEIALRNWVGTFGTKTLSIALTDTFGTRAFLEGFKKPVDAAVPEISYASEFTGVRQDSGDPKDFVKTMESFYKDLGIEGKTMVFSDSLDVEKCLEYKKVCEEAGFISSFGVGTFLTNDFHNLSDGKKSVPLNIVIKLGSASGKPAIKISDNIGKNTGDEAKVAEVKKRLGYVEKNWEEGDETHRWGA